MTDDLPGSGDDPLKFSIAQGPGYMVVWLAGEIDLATEPAL